MSLFDLIPDALPRLARCGGPLLAQAAATREVTEWDYFGPAQWDGSDWLFAGLFLLAAVYVVGLYIRDTRALPDASRLAWRIWLTTLRLAVVAALFVIFLNPHERTQTQAYRPSRVALLVDTSASMEQPASDPRSSSGAAPPSRAAVIRKLLTETRLIEELQATHQVDLYTFDADLSENQHRFRAASGMPERRTARIRRLSKTFSRTGIPFSDRAARRRASATPSTSSLSRRRGSPFRESSC